MFTTAFSMPTIFENSSTLFSKIAVRLLGFKDSVNALKLSRDEGDLFINDRLRVPDDSSSVLGRMRVPVSESD